MSTIDTVDQILSAIPSRKPDPVEDILSALPPQGLTVKPSSPSPLEEAAWESRLSPQRWEKQRARVKERQKKFEETNAAFLKSFVEKGGTVSNVPSQTPSSFETALADIDAAERASKTASSRFTLGAASTVARTGRGISRAFGFSEIAEAFEFVAEDAATGAGGVAGTAGSIAGGLPLFVAAAAGSLPTAAVGLTGLFIDAFGNAQADMDDFERAHDIAIEGDTRLAVAVGSGTINAVVGRLGRGITTRVQTRLVQQVGKDIIAGNTKAAAAQITRALGLSTAEAGGINAVAQMAQNLVVQQGYDESRSLLEGVPEAAALGAALGVIGPGVGLPRALGAAKNVDNVKAQLVKSNLVTAEEARIAGDDISTLVDVATRRRGGELVELNSKNGKLEVTSQPDVISWDERRALSFNEALIDEVRTQRKAGKTVDIFIEPERGIVRPEEAAQIKEKLKALDDSIKADPTEFDSTSGVPLTKRAILKGDTEFLLKKLDEDPTSRTTVSQARLLVETARRRGLAESTEPYAPTADVVGVRERVVTPLEVNPSDRLKLRMAEASGKGYFKDPVKLTPDLKKREVIRALQVKTLRQLFELRREARGLNPAERHVLARILETEFVERMDKILKRKTDTPRGAKLQILREIKNSKVLPDDMKVVESTRISDSIDEISRTSKTISQEEALARLYDDLSDPSKNVPRQILDLVEDLHRRVVEGDGKVISASERARRGLRNTEKLSKMRLVLSEKSRALVGKHISDTLPPEQARILKEQLAAATDNASLREIILKTKTAQETLIRENTASRVGDLVEKLEKNPRKQEGMALLERVFGEKRTTVAAPPTTSRTTATTKSWFSDLVTSERADITPLERERWKLAKDSREWGKQSDAHGYFSRRFDTLVETGALSKDGATLLRYILSEFSPNVLARVSSIREANFIPIPERPGETAYGEWNWQTRSMRVLRDLKAQGVSDTQVFLHELFHGIYFNFMSPDQVRQVDQIWSELTNTPGKRGKTAAHDIVLATMSKDVNVDYFANDPAEFFAEAGANYVLETKVSSPVLRRIIDQTVIPIFKYLLSLTKIKPTEFQLPTAYKEAFEKAIRGERGKLPGTLAEKLGEAGGFEVYSKPVLKKDSKSGAVSVDNVALRERLAKLSIDQGRDLANELSRIVRKGQVEKGLYDRWLKFQGSKDAADALAVITKKAEQGDLRKKLDVPISLGKAGLDPVMVDAMLLQWVGGDTSNPFYQVMHGNLLSGYSRSQTAMADGRRALAEASKKHLGIDASTTSGEFKFINYLREKMANGIQRDEAMWAYALSTDEGRAEVLKRVGIEARSKKFDVDESIGALSAEDKAFVDDVKRHFENNASVEKAFNVYTLLNGYVPERYKRWFSSRREVERQRLPESLAEFELEITRAIDPLKERTLQSNAPFKVDGGFAAEFYNVVDRLATYGEMGKELYRAEKLLINPDVKRELTARFGESRYKYLTRYLQNIQGAIGSSADFFDVAVRYGTRARNISKLGLNVVSGVKQTLSVLTALGDDVLDNSAIVQAMAEGSFASKRVGRTMKENSGFTYLRLSPGRFAEQLLVLGHRTISPKLSLWQDRALFLQKFFDDHTLRILWRSAEIMGKRRGLKGNEYKEFVTSTFEMALQRNQTSSSAMYVSELELKAAQNPLLLGTLSFKRELNRVYNVSRRHVITAVQKPTPENIKKAVNAVLFAGVANTGANVLMNNARRLAFGLGAYSAMEWLTESIRGLTGQLYLAGNVADGIADIASDNGLRDADYLGIFGTLVLDGLKTGGALYKAIEAGKLEEKDRYVESGVNRGQDKVAKNLQVALDRGLSTGSALLGLPIWMLYYQGKGLYNWKREDWRLMTALEKERVQLERNPEKNADRLRDIGRLKERINKIHRLRERGLIERKEAQRQIADELRWDRGT